MSGSTSAAPSGSRHGPSWTAAQVYPEPTLSSVVVGNPAVYPPLFVLLTVPLATLASVTAAWVWLVVLGAVVVASMWLLGVRDWRCYVVALLSPVVLQGLILGNLTIALLLPLALAWRYRDRAVFVGLSIGAAMPQALLSRRSSHGCCSPAGSGPRPSPQARRSRSS